MVVPRTADARVGVLVLYGLKDGEGVGKYTDLVVFRECGESHVHGDEFRTHDSAGFLHPSCVYIEGNGGKYVYYGCP